MIKLFCRTRSFFCLTKSFDFVILAVPNILLLSERFVYLTSDSELAVVLFLLFAVESSEKGMTCFLDYGYGSAPRIRKADKRDQ